MGQRVLIADDNALFARSFAHALRARGYDTRIAANSNEAKELIQFWYPDFAFVDLLLPGKYAISILKFAQSKQITKSPKIVVMSKQSVPAEVEAVRRLGAVHYLVKPFRFRHAVSVMDPQFAKKTQLFKPEGSAKDSMKSLGRETLSELHLLDLFLRQVNVSGDESQVLYNLMRMIGIRVGALRCSLIRCLNEETGIIIASNDNEEIRGRAIQLFNYPEVREVRKRQRPLIIANVKSADLMAPVRNQIINTPYESLAIFPVYSQGRFYGTLSVRLEQRTRKEMMFISKFGQICSQILSLRLSSEDTQNLRGAV